MSKFEIYKDKKKEYRLRLKASNGKIIFTTEGYKRKQSAINAYEVIENAVNDYWCELVEL